jgi:hypothetical protein
MAAFKVGNDGLYWQADTLYVQDDFGRLIELRYEMAVQRKFTLA